MIAAAAAALAVAAPSRDELVARWLHANRAHAVARLEPSPHAGAAPHPAPELNALLARELATPGRYHLTQPAPAPTYEPWWRRLLRWIGERWDRLWSSTFGRVHVSPATANGIGDVLLALVALLLFVVAVRVLRNVRFAPFERRTAGEPIEAPPEPSSLYRRACEAADAGEYGTAALLLFAAAVATLGARGEIAAGRSATVGDLRRELRGDAALVPAFDAVAEPFVARAYAERAVDAPQWSRARAAYDSFVTLTSPKGSV